MRAVAAFFSLLLIACGAAAHAEQATIYGGTAGALTINPGAFLPAKTRLVCYTISGNACWDGKAWHAIYPLGPRHYSKPNNPTVACVAIMNISHDCWDGAIGIACPLVAYSGLLPVR